jgi:uncharacterized protein (TIGR02145 family)
VPTDGEWGDILNAMESGSGTTHNTGISYRGTDAGKRGKAACTAPVGTTSGSLHVNDTTAKWYYNANYGTDDYGFRMLPSGYRHNNGSYFAYRGSYAFFWSSSAYSSTSAWCRQFYYNFATEYRTSNSRSTGYSVRCIRD